MSAVPDRSEIGPYLGGLRVRAYPGGAWAIAYLGGLWVAARFVPDRAIRHERGLLEGAQRRNASCRPPSTVMTCPVVLLSRWLISRKYASA